ncbi:MAG TPA: hypothetical protein VK194_02675, partial [Candidatus Deferrimicrobium sp.]|nr:hypothetical protein [Candidatus Deferrimicrobium sp.]
MPDEPGSIPTALAPPRAAGETQAMVSVPGPKPPDQRRTGIVWVHGIGAQGPRESLFDWTRPIIDVFGEWRREYDLSHRDAT